MRVLLVCPKDVWLDAHRKHLFHPVAGSHWIDLGEGDIIVAAVFKDAATEEAFLAMPGVAPLPDPIREGNVAMIAHRDNPATPYLGAHHEALKAIGILDSDTVVDVSKKTQAIHPLVKLAHIV